MKRAGSLIRKNFPSALIWAIALSVIPISHSSAAPIVESFGNGSCAIQTSGLTIQQNGTSIPTTMTYARASLTSSYGGSYGLTSCNIQIYTINSNVVFTFPTNSQPTSFSFWSGAVDGLQPGTVTYSDLTTETFTVKNDSPSVGELFTFNGNGKIITSFHINGISGDLWMIDNLTWSAAVATATTTSISSGAAVFSKGAISTLTLSATASGKITLFANGKRVPGCISRAITSSITCSWRPGVQGAIQLSAVFTPSSSAQFSSSSALMTALVRKRAALR